MDFVEIERWTKEMRFIFWIAELHLGLIILEFLSLSSTRRFCVCGTFSYGMPYSE